MVNCFDTVETILTPYSALFSGASGMHIFVNALARLVKLGRFGGILKRLRGGDNESINMLKRCVEEGAIQKVKRSPSLFQKKSDDIVTKPQPANTLLKRGRA